MDGEQLTEQETALYDRQIRVWGADAQRRLSKSHILVYGMKGTIAEFCKNIVLAGVGSVTLMDDRAVTEEALASNFLIPRDENVYSGRSLAELCCDSLKEFNPMVRVSVEKGWGFLTLTNVSDICCSSFNVLAKLSDLVTMGFQFFEKFDVIVISCCPLATKILVNEKCRKLAKRIAFYTVECRDSCGEIFVDLQNYKYMKKAKADGLAAEYEIPYPSFQEAINAPWGSLHRKTSKLYFAMRVIERFEEANNRNPGNLSSEDVPAVLQFKRQLCEAQSVSEALVPDTLLERLVMGSIEFPPVCAIVGGILGQEVIKAISGKGDPLKNFFYFDVVDGKGVIEDISTMAPETEPAAAVPPTILEL
uniref:Putative SUMO-activating enzyme 1A transcript 2 n=1 Tax=Linum usitatissimum TaxID=4006 RepID=F6LC71_LINUS|nr:putative SUMO-activating enzyme 1A transcript 2 [Linum usitatissimum]